MYDYLRRSNSRKFLQNQKASGSHEAQNIYIIWKSHQIFNKKKFSSTLLQSNLSLPTPLSCQKSYIPYFHNTDSSVKRKIGSVPLVSALKRFDCINFPALTRRNPAYTRARCRGELKLLISRQSKGCEDEAVLFAQRLSLTPLIQVLGQGEPL